MINTRSILLVDDNDDLREALAEQLHFTERFSVSEANSVATAINLIQEKKFDTILLDIQLPDGDGLEVCKRLRRRGVTSPVIMLTAQSSDSDIVIGLESGANDYITKPFQFRVLLARIEAQLRQNNHTEETVFKIGNNTFHPETKIITDHNNRQIHLTEKEASILRILCQSRLHVVSREVLLKEVWNYNKNVSTHTLETHIYRLRRKIHTDLDTPHMLITEAGGYKLVQ